jgi:uncharacterized protein HemX
MPDFRAPRVRMPRITLPGRAGGRAPKPTASKAKTKEQPKPGNGKPAATTETVAKPGTAKTAPVANVQERIEGLQGWMAEIERKQGRMTYFGIACLVIAILVAGAALYVGLTAKSDSAKKGDLDGLSKRIDSLEAAATKSSKDTQAALNASVAQLQQSISSLQKQESQNSANISTLQSQAASGAFGKGAAGAGAGAGTTLAPVTPGATTTTPNGK